MHIGQALDLVSRHDSLRNPLTSLGDYLDPELISRCLAESGTVTLRKRRLPLEMMVWCIVGMALERKEPLHQIVNLYSHRWEIELGYREIKQTMQLSRLTLRSKKPELVEQELWGVLLAYNLVRYQMIKMAGALKGYWPNQLSFSESCGLVMRMLMTLKGASPGRLPELMGDLESLGKMVKLPIRRERAFPRVVKERPWKYPKADKKASQLLN